MKNRKNRRTVIAAKRIRSLGALELVHSGTQFYIRINGVKFESVRTPASAKRMFQSAVEAVA